MGHLKEAAAKFSQWLGAVNLEEFRKEYLSYEAEYQGGPMYEDGCFVFADEEKLKMEIPVYVMNKEEIVRLRKTKQCGVEEAKRIAFRKWEEQYDFVKVPRKMLQSILDRLDALENSPSITFVNQTIYSGTEDNK